MEIANSVEPVQIRGGRSKDWVKVNPGASGNDEGYGSMDLETVEKKFREARFFLEKMIDQEGRAFGDKEPFDFYLSAFLNATRTVDYRLRHEHGALYAPWRKNWDAALPAKDAALIKFMVDDRIAEVHQKGSARGVKDETIPVHGSYTDNSGTLIITDIPPVLSGLQQRSAIVKPTYNFTIGGVERKATEVCGEYLALLKGMLDEFKADNP
jgi:hypothetical protein